MPSKQRTALESTKISGSLYTNPYLLEYFRWERIAFGNNCLHYKTTRPFNGISSKLSSPVHPVVRDNSSLYRDYAWQDPRVQRFVASNFQKANWKALPSSSDFDAVVFFAEIRDAITVFTVKFWQQLQYGGITWGVMPLVKDLQAILKSIAFLASSKQNLPYTSLITERLSLPEGPNQQRIDLFGVFRMRGHISYDDVVQQADILLDNFPIELDILTLWELTPFSFVLDYILPVGDFLSQFVDRTNVNYIRFSGWSSALVTMTSTDYWTDANYVNYVDFSASADHEYYIRRYIDTVVDVIMPPVANLEFELPSIWEVLNIFYLAVSHTENPFDTSITRRDDNFKKAIDFVLRFIGLRR